MNEGWNSYDFTRCTDAIYNFWLKQLCSVYVEASKPIYNSEDSEQKRVARNTIYNCYEIGLRLLHPFMPFVTEELWQRLPRRESDTESIMIAPYPDNLSSWKNENLEREMDIVQDIVHQINAMRGSYNIAPKQLTDTYFNCKDEESKELVSKYTSTIKGLGFVNNLDFINESTLKGCSVEIVNPTITVLIQLQGIIDIDAEIKKLGSKLEGMKKSLEKLQDEIDSPLYQNTPQAKKDANEQKLEDLKTKIATSEKALAGLQ